MNLYDKLTEYAASDVYPFHMPGHKRRLGSMQDPFSFDLTEIDGFDDLHSAEGIILEAQERAAKLWQSSETFFLVNGSTCGILSAVLACAGGGTTLVMARNCHISAYNAAALSRQDTYYLMPSARGVLNGPVDPDLLENALDNNNNVSAVLVTSPTYDGIVSDIARLADVAHRHGIPLIVDEAHGAHFGMHPDFPQSSVVLGADLVIHSLHKTLPSLTQTAILHVNGSLIDRQRLRSMLDIFQTSSPSYVLMASIDQCVRMLLDSGSGLFDRYTACLRAFRAQFPVPGIRLLDTDDPSRILLQPDNMTAKGLYDLFRLKYRLQPEMCCPSYVLMLSSVADGEDAFARLLNAALEIGRSSSTSASGSWDAVCTPGGYECAFPAADVAAGSIPSSRRPYPDVKMSLFRALNSPRVRTPLDKASGLICAEYIYMYPPGSPLIAPGEVLTDGLLKQILLLKDAGYPLKGCADRTLETIYTVKRR